MFRRVRERVFLPVLAAVALLAAGMALAAEVSGTDDGVTAYELLQFLHIFLFVFWIGPEVGVYIWSQKVSQAALGVEQRATAAEMMRFLDTIPRAAMALMLTIGGLLSEYVGLEHPWWQMAGIVLLGPVWLTLVLVAGIRDGTAFGDTAEKYDTWLRWLLVVSIPLSVTWSSLTGRLSEAPYVGVKLLLFAVIVLLGLGMKAKLKPLRTELATLTKHGASDVLNASIAATVGGARRYAIGIWVLLLIAAFVGVVKPGT